MTNTNWQFYAGEATLSYLSQMAGLAVQNFASAAVGIAVMAAVVRGFARRGTDDARQLLGRPGPHHALRARARSPSSSGIVLGSQGVMQTFDDPVTYQTLEARTLGVTGDGRRARHPDAVPRAGRVADRDQAGRDQRRRLLQLQLGGARSRTRAPSPTIVELWAELVIAFALTYTFGLMVGSRRQGWAIFAAMMVDPRRGDRGDRAVRAARRRGAPVERRRAAGRRRPVGREHERQGGPLRRRPHRPVGRRHHRHLDRRRQRRPRRADRRRRRGDARPDDDRGGRARRRRLGDLRDAAVRRRRGVHRRADGGPHPRVPGQEDRGPRDQAHDDRRAGHADRAPGDARGRGHHGRRARRRSSTPGHRGSPRPSTPTRRSGTTTAARSPATA